MSLNRIAKPQLHLSNRLFQVWYHRPDLIIDDDKDDDE